MFRRTAFIASKAPSAIRRSILDETRIRCHPAEEHREDGRAYVESLQHAAS
jgi:hypothetical protein